MLRIGTGSARRTGTTALDFAVEFRKGSSSQRSESRAIERAGRSPPLRFAIGRTERLVSVRWTELLESGNLIAVGLGCTSLSCGYALYHVIFSTLQHLLRGCPCWLRGCVWRLHNSKRPLSQVAR